MLALNRFRKAVAANSTNAEHVISSYDHILDTSEDVTPEKRSLLDAAQCCLKMQESVLAAIQSDNDEQIAFAYDEALARYFTVFTAEQQARINKGLKQGVLELALQSEDYGRAIRLAQEITLEIGKPLTDIRLTLAKKQFIKQFDVNSLEAIAQGDEVIARWRWPPDDLVRFAMLVWRVDRWPQHLRFKEYGTGQVWAFRNRNEQTCITMFKVVPHEPIYLRAFFAIPDESQQPPEWFFSEGNEPGSGTIIRIEDQNP